MKYDRFHYGILCGAVISWGARFIGEGEYGGIFLLVIGFVLLYLGVRDMKENK